MDKVVNIETFEIGPGYKITDNSGYYACPAYLNKGKGGVVLPGANVCTKCGAKLVWK